MYVSRLANSLTNSSMFLAMEAVGSESKGLYVEASAYCCCYLTSIAVFVHSRDLLGGVVFVACVCGGCG